MKTKKRVFVVLFIIFTLILTFSLSSMAKPLLFRLSEFSEDHDENYLCFEEIENIRQAATESVTITYSCPGQPLDYCGFTIF